MQTHLFQLTLLLPLPQDTQSTVKMKHMPHTFEVVEVAAQRMNKCNWNNPGQYVHSVSSMMNAKQHISFYGDQKNQP